MKISREPFGSVDGTPVERITLENDQGVTIQVITYGGTVTSIRVPDKNGDIDDVVCGFDTLEGYFSDAYKGNSPYFGCLVGRYAARIKDGQFEVDGSKHQVATNDGPNHLHGGLKGFDKRVWTVSGTDEASDSVAVFLSLQSADGEESFPGTVDVQVEYRLTNDSEFKIRYVATTDKATPLSLTNHTYFNLSGFRDDVLDHVVQISSDRCLVPDETNVPVGEEELVAGTAADLREPKRVGDAFGDLPLGFEHFYAFDELDGDVPKIAEVREPKSGRKLEVFSTEPGALFYTGRYTSDELKRESGAQFGQFRGLCLETSKYPNGPNIPGAPRSILRPGDTYDETTVYRFSWT